MLCYCLCVITDSRATQMSKIDEDKEELVFKTKSYKRQRRTAKSKWWQRINEL